MKKPPGIYVGGEICFVFLPPFPLITVMHTSPTLSPTYTCPHTPNSQQYKIMELNEGHLRDIQNKLWPARSQWYNIGLGLGLSPDTLDFIDQDNQGADAKFRYMILKWLRGGKECSWEALCEAVSDPSVDRGALASSILQELCPKTFEPKGQYNKLMLFTRYGAVVICCKLTSILTFSCSCAKPITNSSNSSSLERGYQAKGIPKRVSSTWS